MINIHGGDVYRNKVNMDFSVNVNPLGVPENVTKALAEAVSDVTSYPDIRSEKLKNALGEKLGVDSDFLTFGNGSSELLMAIAHALKPKKVLIPVPSFYGYEYAFGAVCDDIVYYPLKEEDDYRLTDSFVETLDDADLVVIGNPNNPTGYVIENELLAGILDACKDKKITVIIDECFIEFTDAKSMISDINDYPNLIILRSFTKIYAIPSVRLGYIVCSDKKMIEKVERQLPEWNVSGIAQSAGYECIKCDDYILKSRVLVRGEREYLINELKKLGIKTYPSEANYFLFKTDKPLFELLLDKEIMIRDCSNYRGLKDGYYRIAVRTHEENVKLIENMQVIYERN